MTTNSSYSVQDIPEIILSAPLSLHPPTPQRMYIVTTHLTDRCHCILIVKITMGKVNH